MALAFLALLGACTPAAPPAASLTLGALAPGDPPWPGALAGRVFRLVGDRFSPAAGAEVAIDGVPRATVDAAGRYVVAGLAAGAHDVTATLAGHLGSPARVRLPSAMGVVRANLALVASASGLADRTIAGVVADPRGSALPAADVRLVDSASAGGAGGNRQVRADDEGCFVVALPGVGASALTAGVAYLTATGLTPGGVRVETTRVAAVALDDRAHVAVAVVADAFKPIAAPVAVAPDRVRASGLPTRRDELVLRWSGQGGDAEFAAAAIGDGEVQVVPPPGCCDGEGRLALLVFGIADGEAPPAVAWPLRAP